MGHLVLPDGSCTTGAGVSSKQVRHPCKTVLTTQRSRALTSDVSGLCVPGPIFCIKNRFSSPGSMCRISWRAFKNVTQACDHVPLVVLMCSLGLQSLGGSVTTVGGESRDSHQHWHERASTLMHGLLHSSSRGHRANVLSIPLFLS